MPTAGPRPTEAQLLGRVAQAPVLAVAKLEQSPIALGQTLDLRHREHFELVVLDRRRLHEPPPVPPGVALRFVDLGDIEERSARRANPPASLRPLLRAPQSLVGALRDPVMLADSVEYRSPNPTPSEGLERNPSCGLEGLGGLEQPERAFAERIPRGRSCCRPMLPRYPLAISCTRRM